MTVSDVSFSDLGLAILKSGIIPSTVVSQTVSAVVSNEAGLYVGRRFLACANNQENVYAKTALKVAGYSVLALGVATAAYSIYGVSLCAGLLSGSISLLLNSPAAFSPAVNATAGITFALGLSLLAARVNHVMDRFYHPKEMVLVLAKV